MIPVNTPNLSGNEAKYLAECIDTGWISSEGPFVKRLEDGVAGICDRENGIAVCNGSAALDSAVAALGIGEGDEVIIPTFTIISCALAVVHAGATPVVVDCDPLTMNMTVELVSEAITDRTKAIMIVHLYGLPVDLDPILELAKKHDLRVIEDAAEVIGQTYKEKPCGSFGDISTLSFYPNKHITAGEGGMVLTDDPGLATRCRDIRNLCFGKKRRFVHEQLGYNFRLSNLQAAVGVAQLERLGQSVRRKREIGRMYQEKLAGLPGVQLPLPHTDYAENIYWIFGLVLESSHRLNVEQRIIDEEQFPAEIAIKRLGEMGIGCRPFFWPMHEQPVLQERGFFKKANCPVAERLARNGFYIPSGLGLTDEDIDQVAKAVWKTLG